MAKIEWEDQAKFQFRHYVKNARLEFGEKTAKRWLEEIIAKEWRLERYPESYPPEELLSGRKNFYRMCHLINRRFKLIYYYDKYTDTIFIVNIWDTKCNPQNLIRRIK